MNNNQHYTGLTDAQVLESREKYGLNILTPPEKETLWDRLRKTCTHWIPLSLAILVAITVVAAALLTGRLGQVIWVMPAILLLATLFIIVVGFFGGFKDPLFRILITAFVLSIGISIYEFEWAGASFSTFFEPIGIIVALLLATGVAYFLERSNEKTFQSLNKVNDDTPVKVIRNDNVSQVARRDIVVGDIVIVETGEEVPADCELLESLNLLVNESSLTGEPQATKTTIEKDFDGDATYPSNHIMKGTTIIEGYCTARVFAVGDRTESGKVFQAAQVEEGDPTPLSRKLNTLARWITTASYVIAALVIVGRVISYFLFNAQQPIANGQQLIAFDWLDFITYVLNTFMIAVTLIVVAVPEGLPMSVTLSMAFSMRKLMKQNTLPRTMHSCETMGAATVICTDKTGTLTQNQMQVAEARISPFVAPQPQHTEQLLAEMIAVNTTANLDLSDPAHPKAIGNPTEGALLLWLHAQGIDYQKIRERATIIDRLPFSTENKYMATVVQSDILVHTLEGICNPRQTRMLYVKGAPEILMGFSSIDEKERKALEEALLSYQQKAMRTLALAYLELDDTTPLPSLNREGLGEGLKGLGLHFVGIFAISDPVRQEVPAAINDCIGAGIQVKIVTGDTPGTAKEIGRQIGLWTDTDTDSNIMTGVEFAAMTDEELQQRIPGMKILARARPNDKERLVRMLKAQGQVVAVTGDVTNDAPALNAADVGLSMGDGTAVAKESSDMTIQDNSFSTIANAVMWGRSLYKNIQRFVMFQMTINVVACLIVLIGAFLGTESPLTVTQMLWVNLIMDTFAAIALASLPPTRKVMLDEPRRDTDPIITRPMAWNIVGVGGFFTLLLLALLLYMQHYDISGTLLPSFGGVGGGLSPYELSLFFTIFVMLQFWNMFNAKAFMTDRSAFSHLTECRGFMCIAIVIFVGQILIVELGGQMFNVTHLHPVHWLIIIASTSLVLWVGEVIRKILRKPASA
ncbi:MAG: calcium-translocating P-type ATPase, PMCA-type [Prevotella sp.]|nr:calcium-translocating P-type ATPase, PMCA-type [Prevotella sp.]